MANQQRTFCLLGENLARETLRSMMCLQRTHLLEETSKRGRKYRRNFSEVEVNH